MLIKIKAADIGKRLDLLLTEKITTTTRSQLQKAINSKKILVNDQPVAKHYFLKVNDSLTYPDDLLSASFRIKPNSQITFQIVSEDDNYLIINKPAGLIVHPSLSHPVNDTLINGVLAYYPRIVSVGEDQLRLGIIHRLDREVSGLMVIPKTQTAFFDLKKQFKQHTVHKEYLALVHGQINHKQGSINLNIARSKTKKHKMAAHADGQGKTALTEYSVVQQFSHYTYLQVIIHTGRTHQIRVHFNALGYPLVGDRVYCPRSQKTVVKLGRIFLHSYKLGFHDLSGNYREFIQELPGELKELLNTL